MFKVEEVVSVKIPRIDRSSSDLPRLPCVVVGVTDEAKQFYRLKHENVANNFFKIP